VGGVTRFSVEGKKGDGFCLGEEDHRTDRVAERGETRPYWNFFKPSCPVKGIRTLPTITTAQRRDWYPDPYPSLSGPGKTSFLKGEK